MLARAGLVRKSAAAAAEFEARRESPRFRRVMMIMTLVWSVGLVASAMLACLLVLALSIHDYMIASPILGYATMGGLGLWTVWYRRRAMRRGEAARAAEAARLAEADRLPAAEATSKS